MKKITGLDERLDHFDMIVPEKQRPQLPTFRNLFVNCLGAARPDNGAQAIESFKAATKILRAEGDSVLLEDAEFKLLREKCEKNELAWQSYYLAQVILRIDQAETVAIDISMAQGGKK